MLISKTLLVPALYLIHVSFLLSTGTALSALPLGSDFYALPLPWGALQQGAFASPAWRVMSIAPAGSSSNSSSVHKKTRTSHSPSALRRIVGRERGWGVLSPSYQILSLSVCLSPPVVFLICFLEPFMATLCMMCEQWEPGLNSYSPKASVSSPRCTSPILSSVKVTTALCPIATCWQLLAYKWRLWGKKVAGNLK